MRLVAVLLVLSLLASGAGAVEPRRSLHEVVVLGPEHEGLLLAGALRLSLPASFDLDAGPRLLVLPLVGQWRPVSKLFLAASISPSLDLAPMPGNTTRLSFGPDGVTLAASGRDLFLAGPVRLGADLSLVLPLEPPLSTARVGGAIDVIWTGFRGFLLLQAGVRRVFWRPLDVCQAQGGELCPSTRRLELSELGGFGGMKGLVRRGAAFARAGIDLSATRYRARLEGSPLEEKRAFAHAEELAVGAFLSDAWSLELSAYRAGSPRSVLGLGIAVQAVR